MKRLLSSLFLLLLANSMSGAHFIWVVPDKGTATAQILFSDSLTPDKAELLAKVAHTKWYARDNSGKTHAVKWAATKDGYSLAAPAKGPHLLGGSCSYGVVQRGKDDPFLLNYYAMALVGASQDNRPSESVYAPWDVLPMQILPAKGTARGFVVLFHGQPLADADVVVQAAGQEKTATMKTNSKGVFELAEQPQGRWALRAGHVEKKADTQNGKDYKEIRHYVTRVVNMPSLRPVSAGTNDDLVLGMWKNVTPPTVKTSFKDHVFCQGVTVDPKRPGTIYLCICAYDANKGGLHKSTDSGKTWKKIGHLDEPLHVAVNPDNSNHLYCVDGVRGKTLGFWVSKDGGENWSMPEGFKKATEKPVGTRDLYSLAVDPTDFKHLLVTFHSPWANGKNCGVLQSKDGGESWIAHDPPPTLKGGYGMAVFFLFDPIQKIGNKDTWLFTAQEGGFFKTTDGGKTWSNVYKHSMTHGGNQLYRAKDGTLYSGGYQFPARSTDNGSSWEQIKQGLVYSWYMGICGDGENIYTACSNKNQPFFVSPEKDGKTWKPLNDQKFSAVPFAMAFDPVNRILYSASWEEGLLAMKMAAAQSGALPSPKTDFLGDALPKGAIARLGTERFRHPGPIRALKFTPDNKLLISFGYDSEPMVWNVETGKRVGLETVPKHQLLNYSVTSLDEKFIAAIKNDATEFEVIDKAKGKSILTRKNPALWAFVAFARDGKTVLALGADNAVTAWDIVSGKETSKRQFGFAPWPRFAEDFPAPTLALDGSILAGVLKEDWKDLRDPVRVRFWDPLTGKENRKSITLSRSWKHWSLSTDGNQLTVHFWDSEIQIWDTQTGKATQISKGGDSGAEGVLYIPNKKLAVTSGWGNVYLQDLENDKVLWNKEVAPPNVSGPSLKLCRVNRFALSPDGKVVAAGTDNGHIELLDLATGGRVGGSRLHPGFFTGPLRFLPGDKHVLVTLGWKTALWDLSQNKKVRDLGFEIDDDDDNLSPDGQRLFHIRYGKETRHFVLSDTLSGKELWTRQERYAQARFSGDNQTLAIFHANFFDKPEVKFIATTTGKDTRVFFPLVEDKGKRIPPGRPFAVSREMLVAIETTDRTAIQLWDPATDKKLWTWTMPADCREHLWAIHFLPGKKHILAEMSHRVDIKHHLFLIDAETGKQLRAINGWELQSISADGRYAAFGTSVGGKGFYLEVHDLNTGETVLKEKERDGRGQRRSCFSADSRIFACNLDGSTIEFFDIQSKKRIGQPRPHTAYIRHLTFAPNRPILAVCYNDSTVIFWDANSKSP